MADFEMARNLLSEVDWDDIIDESDVNKSLRDWESCFMEIMEKCIPKGVLPRRKNPPWLTKNLLRAMRKRNSLFRRARKTNHPNHWKYFRAYRNKTVSMLRQSKQEFFANNLSISNKKQFWKTMKYLNKSQSTIPTLSHNGQKANNDLDKANMLNTFFADCFNIKLPPLSASRMDNSSHECPESLLCTEQEVLMMLKAIDTSKASGPDKISGRMLKETAESIATPIAMIFNMSIQTGVFPHSWKLSSIVPIPKSSENASPTNYRPISLLSVLSKLLEKYIHGLIMDHLQSEHPLSGNQWGFQAGKSTISALLGTCHSWLEILEKGEEVEAVFFDFKKAFDTVPHEALLRKLNEIQLDGILIRWIRSYLTDRMQQVVVNGATSDMLPVLSGVPQGSLLGPLLFLIYIDGVNNIGLSVGSNLVLYADDMLLYRPVSSPEDYLHLQADIDAIAHWVDINLLQFNVQKCKAMKITRKKQSASTPILKLNSQILQRTDAYKYLGLLISHDLSWSDHIRTICSKAKRMLGMLYRRFYQYADSNTLLQMYISLVRPHLEYGSPVWNPYKAADVKLIEGVQKFALRMCTKNWNESYETLLEMCQLQSHEDRRIFIDMSTMFKIVHNMMCFPPNIFCSQSPSQRVTRSTAILAQAPQLYFQSVFAHTNQFYYSFVPRSIRTWNSLPLTLINSSIPYFKNNFWAHI